MSVKIMGGIWELDLPRGEALVLLALADHADHLGNSVYPSVGLVAWKTGLSERHTQRLMRGLEKKGLLVRVRFREGGRGHTTHYRIDLEKARRKSAYEPQKGDADDTHSEKRVTSTTERVTPVSVKGDTAMSPEPSLTVIESNASSGGSAAPSARDANAPPNRGKLAPSRSLSLQQEMFSALCEVFQLNPTW